MSGVSRRARACRCPNIERLEDMVLLSTAPVVNLGASGGSGGTSLVKDIVPGSPGSFPSALAPVGGHLYFTAVNPLTTRNELFVTDGTDAGTVAISPGLEASTPLGLGNAVVFTAFDVDARTFGIYTTDGIAADTHRIAVLPSSGTDGGVSADGVVYFEIVNFGARRTELWKSDGTSTGTGMVAVIPDASDFTVAGSKVYFQAAAAATGAELWVTDGTAAGTHVVRDINPGFDGSYPTNLTPVGGTLYFTAFNSFGEPNRLWKTDGTSAGTSVVDPTLEPVRLANLGDKLAVITADIWGENAALWTSNGTSGGTTHVVDLPSGQFLPMAVAGGKAFFVIKPDAFAEVADVQLWSSDGTTGGTGLIATLDEADQLTASGGRVYFSGDGPAIGRELWVSDGTAAGTAPVSDINPGTPSSNPFILTDASGVLYFTADDGTHGRELWQSSPATQQPGTSLNEGGSFIFPGSFTDNDGAPWTATVNYGDGTGSQPLALAADHSFILNHQYRDNGSFIITVAVTDSAGLSGAASLNVDVVNVAPEPTIVGIPLSSPEGTAVNLSALVNDPSPVDAAAGFTLSWNVTRNGGTFAAGSGSSFSFTPDDNGSYLVVLTAQDKDGGIGSTSAQLLIVTNVAPNVTLVGVPAGAEGAAVSFTAQATDPSSVDTAAGLTLSWNVTRNGAPFASGAGGAVSFTPDDDGTYVTTVLATDKDGGTGAATATITVVNTAPSASITGAPAAGTEGTAISLGSLVSDPSPSDAAAGFARSWSVTRNGSPFTAGSGAGFSFVPTDNGVYVVTLTATDKDGGSSTATATINVVNAAPTAALAGDSSGVRGQTRNFNLSAADPSSADSAAGFTFQINWGDGSPAQTIAPGQSTAVGHVFKSTGTFTLQVTATDKDGASSLVTTNAVTIQVVQLQADPADPTKTALVVGGTAGDDTIQFKRDNLGRIKVKLNDTSLGAFSPTGHLIAFGQAGNDVIQVANNVSLPSILHGGDGDDVLMGGGGDAILVGGRGEDLLSVDGGRNLLIGGASSDLIHGGSGDNIVVGGCTTYDDNDAALVAILAEWERNATLQQRVDNLKVGIAGGIALDSDTVVKDQAGDALLDVHGHDWLLVESTDLVLAGRCGSIVSKLNQPDWDEPGA